MPKVSFLTSVFNGSDYILDAIESVKSQSFKDWEYVIVDDGSTDGTSEKLAMISDLRVRIVSLQRSGRGKALNEGLDHCTGDFIAILDADDQASKYRIEVQLKIFGEFPEFAVLSSECVFLRNEILHHVPDEINVVELKPRSLLHGSRIVHSSVLIRKSALLAVGGYDEKRDCLFDFDLWIRLMSKDYKVGLIGLPLVFRMLHDNQFFENKRRATYLFAGLIARYRVVFLFRKSVFDWLIPLAYFFYGWLPRTVRQKTTPLFYKF